MISTRNGERENIAPITSVSVVSNSPPLVTMSLSQNRDGKKRDTYLNLKENGEYHAAREEQSLIVYKKQLLQSHAPFQFVGFGEIETDEVSFGNKVAILEEGKDEAEDYYLLGPIEFELDLYPMIVTYHSPFGQAMVGKKLNEDFTLEIGDKEINPSSKHF
mgnify:CR=1 FL=1